MTRRYTGVYYNLAVKRLGLMNVWLAVTAVVVVGGLLVMYGPSFPPQVPLWYSRPWGEDQLAPPTALWLVPGLIVLAAAAAAWGKSRLKEPVLAALWLAAMLVVQLILALAAVRIVWLVVF